jgi:hypothetical protein
MSDVHYFYTQTARPSEHEPTGAIAEGWYIIEDGTVILTDSAGKPISEKDFRLKPQPGEEVLAVARKLLRAKMGRQRDFLSRKLVYPNVGVA